MYSALELLASNVLASFEKLSIVQSYCDEVSHSPYMREKVSSSLIDRKAEVVDSLYRLGVKASETDLTKESIALPAAAIAAGKLIAANKGLAIGGTALASGALAAPGYIGRQLTKATLDETENRMKKWKQNALIGGGTTLALLGVAAKSGLLGEDMRGKADSLTDIGNLFKKSQLLAMTKTYDKIACLEGEGHLDSISAEEVTTERVKCGAALYDMLFE